MKSKLYVANLPDSTRAADLRILFSEAGIVLSVTLIKDRDSGQSTGRAFVEMSTQIESKKAVSRFDGYQLGERELKVRIARLWEGWGRSCPDPRGLPGGLGGDLTVDAPPPKKNNRKRRGK